MACGCSTMKIGIVGAGGIGQAFASQVAKAGYEVIVSNSRGSESLAEVVKQLGPGTRAATRQQAAQADTVVVGCRALATAACSSVRLAPMDDRRLRALMARCR
jgi:predicted dinucleotide-binding enzyme